MNIRHFSHSQKTGSITDRENCKNEGRSNLHHHHDFLIIRHSKINITIEFPLIFYKSFFSDSLTIYVSYVTIKTFF